LRLRLSWFWLALVVSIGLRVPGMLHDFWFDEAWSALLVREHVASPLDILTQLHIDNNHPLNSFFLYALGDRRAWIVYRIPSLIFGLASVVFAGRIMARRGRAQAVVAMILIACSYPLIVYSSEARGYASMIFFLLLAIDAYERYLVTQAWLALTTFWVAVILGFLSHLTFVHAYGAMLLWAGHEARMRRGESGAVAHIAATHSVPLLFLAAFYLVYIRHLHVAGGEPASLRSVLAETVGATLGTPARGAWLAVAVAALVLVVAAGLTRVGRVDPGLCVFFLSGILVVPAVAILVEFARASFIEPRFFPRYFLVSITLCLLLGSWVLGEELEKGGMRRLAAAIVILGYALGNLWQAADFIRYGRGHYREALAHMARETAEPAIRVASNSDFRTRVLLAFYGRYLPPGRTLIFFGAASPHVDEADWRIREDVEPTSSVPPELGDGRGHRFRLAERYPFYGLSGCQWSLYRRDPRR
jgi:hypothetical protein